MMPARSLLLLCALAFAPSSPAAAQDPGPAHGHGHEPVPAVSAAPVGARHRADAVLREHMAGIGQAVGALEHASHGHLDRRQVVALAQRITRDVQRIVATCQLAPDADAALHRIIVPLAQRAARLEADPGDLSQVPGMRAALHAYERTFAE